MQVELEKNVKPTEGRKKETETKKKQANPKTNSRFSLNIITLSVNGLMSPTER